MSDENIIRVAAVVVLDAQQRVLTVRKRGTSRFMQPGGKPEPGESGAATAIREAQEEIGLTLTADQLRPMGSFSAAAANEEKFTVVCENFLVQFHEEAEAILTQLEPAAEIAELQWIPLDELQPREDLAPLLTEEVAPAVGTLLVDNA
ncbi:NUDIX domain-containing protein [Nesterenkonia sp. MY13]|uniref:NUDIX domain-containing protein n=1 Tax=Nesterenkonia sedimenti TaxID=1463632 RepID=A0A7X8YCV3_9MICC|nr:NUDIX domain-containing protein [Nesterenkonia sedimenti]NLS08815.1 NUDIX domain-containing protein [Nesterenkonia sedimenti]